MNKRDDRHAPMAGDVFVVPPSEEAVRAVYAEAEKRQKRAGSYLPQATPEDEQRFRDLQSTDERLAAVLDADGARITRLEIETESIRGMDITARLAEAERTVTLLSGRLALVENRRGWDMPSSQVWIGFFNSLASRKFLLVVGNAVALLGTAFAGGNDWQTYIPNIIAALVSVGYIVIEGWRDANEAKAEGEVAASVAAASVVAGVHTSSSHGQGQGG